ncbi:nucleotidyltransferase domain-containing protein [Anaerotardibacter muris]|uniref:nucleotidyltransferase domain-containing protein n=1 Tax=Anaerotardibacter muris TaxID=2941505 RepID=UPI00203BEF22|nr:nucleotidyltransferase domain-containing protein [Anaerotardibacter muris]
MVEIDVNSWMRELRAKLVDAFGNRLVLVGIQGSRARGEERETSDIDSVVVIEELTAKDIEVFRGVVGTMPHAELACGFIGSPEVLAAWPRYDVFNLVNDTRVLQGSFDFMNTNFTTNDALLSAKAGASEIYHTLCHTLAFESETLEAVVEACVKNTFFVMRALVFARSGEYLVSRARMRSFASDQELVFLDAYDADEALDAAALANVLIEWAQVVITQT